MPSKRAIVFIDGNNLYHCMREMGLRFSPVDYLKLCETICTKFNLTREKTIYYNSVPTLEAGGEIYYKHMSFLSEIGKLPKFEVRTRKLQRRSNAEIREQKHKLLEKLKVCKACKPVVVQNCMDCIGDFTEKEKGIDVMLAVDMIEKALKGECDYCVLVSGDADFIPALKLIVANNKKVKSAFVPKGYATEIRNTFPKDYFVINEEELEKIMGK